MSESYAATTKDSTNYSKYYSDVDLTANIVALAILLPDAAVQASAVLNVHFGDIT